jgi:hypothetical protein
MSARKLENICLGSTKSKSLVVTLRRGQAEELERISLFTGLSMDRIFGVAIALFLEDAGQALTIPDRAPSFTGEEEERPLTEEQIDRLLEGLFAE